MSSGVSPRTSCCAMTMEWSYAAPVRPGGAQVAHHRGNALGVGVERDDFRHGPGEQVGRFVRQTPERGEMAQREIRRVTNGGAHREAGRLDRNRGASSHRIDERLGSRVPARQHDQLRRERLAQRREPGGHARATSMTRAAAHVDAHHCTPRVRRPRAAHDEHDVRRVAVDVGCDASRRQRLDERVLDDATKLKRRRFEVGR